MNGELYSFLFYATPDRLLASKRIKWLSVGTAHSAAIDCTINYPSFIVLHSDDGVVFMWGINHFGQLGTGDRKTKSIPVPLTIGKPWAKTKIVKCGTSHTIAVTGVFPLCSCLI